MSRTNYCGLITKAYLNQNITIHGWVHKRRDLGGLIFLDIRDREGILQVVVNPDSQCFNIANELRHEDVVTINGFVNERQNKNTNLANGDIELNASSIIILNKAKPIPILIDDATTSETNRMIHRIIDLRGSKMQHNLRLRFKVTSIVREYLNALGFIDIETPLLTRSTPEGARDFLVPSRINKGEFYALPQSPQLFKQLFMVAGFDRYYQITKCFRDEDLRADRQPEFTQIDIETSFLEQQEIQDIAQAMIKKIFHEVLNVDLGEFSRLTYQESMDLYGSDKPDLRIPLKFIDLTKTLMHSQFKVFARVSELSDGKIIALKLPSSINLSRKEIDEYTKFIAPYGANGLAYIKVNDINQLNTEGLQSPIVKFLEPQELQAIIETTGVQNGETLLFAADTTKIVNESFGALRLKLGLDKQLITHQWAPLWVTDFPMFEYSTSDNRYVACHHPFTAPREEDIPKLTTKPNECLAKAYDMVLNGWEIGGGSIRIHESHVQKVVFTALNITPEEAQNKFGFLLDNLQFGAPPHGGIAFGLDRIITIMCNAPSIRDVIAFPKTTKGQCLLTNAPNKIDDAQLTEVGIKTLL